MNDAFRVDVLHTVEQLVPNGRRLLLAQVVALADALEQLSALEQFRHNVRVSLYE